MIAKTLAVEETIQHINRYKFFRLWIMWHSWPATTQVSAENLSAAYDARIEVGMHLDLMSVEITKIVPLA
jgi:hypothetical protein